MRKKRWMRIVALTVGLVCMTGIVAAARAEQADGRGARMDEAVAIRVAQEAVRLTYGAGLESLREDYETKAVLEGGAAYRVTFTPASQGEAAYAVQLDAHTAQLLGSERIEPGESARKPEGEGIGELIRQPAGGIETLKTPIRDLRYAGDLAYFSARAEAAVSYEEALAIARKMLGEIFELKSETLDLYFVKEQYYFVPADDCYLWRFSFTPRATGVAMPSYEADVFSPSGEMAGCRSISSRPGTNY